jgi:hypothetical protein
MSDAYLAAQYGKVAGCDSCRSIFHVIYYSPRLRIILGWSKTHVLERRFGYAIREMDTRIVSRYGYDIVMIPIIGTIKD